jgi:hypothetical protein
MCSYLQLYALAIPSVSSITTIGTRPSLTPVNGSARMPVPRIVLHRLTTDPANPDCHPERINVFACPWCLLSASEGSLSILDPCLCNLARGAAFESWGDSLQELTAPARRICSETRSPATPSLLMSAGNSRGNT